MAKVGEVGEKSGSFCARAIEVVFNGHLDGDQVLNQIREKQYGLYKAFVKWHKNDKNHTHIGLILREKPRLSNPYDYFSIKVGEVGAKPNLVKALGKGNSKPIKKLAAYVAYLCDGHDNGTYEDTWNYKYDYELESISDIVGKAMCLMSRGQSFEQIYTEANWDTRAKLALKKKQILSAWRIHKSIMLKPQPATLRPWQEQALEIVRQQDDRKVMWITDSEGNNGKTKLCKELALHHKAAVFNNAGKKDLAFAYDDQEIVAFNLTRTTEERVNYEAIESLKDGIMFSAKYESETKVFNSPQLVVMSNYPPDFSAMSQDRWDTYELRAGALTKLPSPQTSGATSSAFLL